MQFRLTIRLLKRRFATFLLMSLVFAIGMLGIALFVLGVSLAFQDYTQLTQRFVVNVFLPSQSDSATVLVVKNALQQLPAVDSLEYISPQEALQFFTSRYGELSESLLPSNPLPPTFLLYLRPGFHTPDSVAHLSRMLQRRFPFLDISYRADYLAALDQKYWRTLIAAIAVGLLLFFVFTLLLLNALRRLVHAPPAALTALEYHGTPRRVIIAPYRWITAIAVVTGGGLATAALAGASSFLPSVTSLWTAITPHQLWQSIAIAWLVLLIVTVTGWFRFRSKLFEQP